MNEQIKKTAIEYFSKYFEQNYSGTVVFSDPRWHAPKVFRAALWALKQAEKDNKADAADEIERLQRQVATLSSELAKWVTEAQRSKDSAQETSPAPVEGVVPGSNLERQIQLARQTIERWPDDVRRAMGIVAQETPAAPEKCKCNYPDAWHCARGEHMKACVCGCHAPNRGVL